MQNGKEISLAQIERASEIIMERDGIFAAVVFVLEHFDLVGTGARIDNKKDAGNKIGISCLDNEIMGVAAKLLDRKIGTIMGVQKEAINYAS